jgi:hypothetical protein
VIEVGILGGSQVDWSQQVYFLSLRRNDLPFRVNGCTSNDAHLPVWSGLTNRQRYLQLAAKLS